MESRALLFLSRLLSFFLLYRRDSVVSSRNHLQSTRRQFPLGQDLAHALSYELTAVTVNFLYEKVEQTIVHHLSPPPAPTCCLCVCCHYSHESYFCFSLVVSREIFSKISNFFVKHGEPGFGWGTVLCKLTDY